MRTLTTAQSDALALLDRASHFRVDIEDPDGVMQDMTTLEGIDWVDSISIEADVDNPVGAMTVRLFREVDGVSLAPLMEDSEINRDVSGSYAAFIDVARDVDFYAAVLEPGQSVTASDWVKFAEGIIDDPEWGGRESRIILEARDPMGRLNDTIVETLSTYGGGSPLAAIEDVMQSILNDNMGSGAFPLTVEGVPDFGITEYDLANVSVLQALMALADLQGWNLHWKWDTTVSPEQFSLTYYEPTRDAVSLSGYAPDHTFGPDDYYDVQKVGLNSRGIRNAGEVVYTDSAGAEQTVSDTRSTSVAKYERRFIRMDERDGAITTAAQANALLAAVLDDLEDPFAEQVIETAFFWPIELGDMYRYTANDVHYSTDQDWAVVGYRHELSQGRKRTIITAAGKPAGGYTRWHRREATTREQREIRRPTVSVAQSQTGTTGTLTIAITDPHDVVSATAFQPSSGAGDFDLSTDPTTWAVYDNTAPFTVSDTVTITSKHTSRIGWAVRYRTRTGIQEWIRGAGAFDLDEIAEITNITVTFDENGEAVVSVTGDEDTANIYVTVGDGTTPSDPTAGVNDGSIAGRNGTVSTGVKITTGNEAIVKAIAADSNGTVGPVQVARQGRRIGPFHKDTTSRPHSGDGVETTLETITIPANTLGSDGGLRLTGWVQAGSLDGTLAVRIKLGGSSFASHFYTGTAGAIAFQVVLFNDGATNVQDAFTIWTATGGSTGEEIDAGSGAVDSTSNMDLTITVELGFGATGTAGTATLQLTHAELIGTD